MMLYQCKVEIHVNSKPFEIRNASPSYQYIETHGITQVVYAKFHVKSAYLPRSPDTPSSP